MALMRSDLSHQKRGTQNRRGGSVRAAIHGTRITAVQRTLTPLVLVRFQRSVPTLMLFEKGGKMQLELNKEAIEAIQAIVSAGKTAEIVIRNGKIVVWETRSKKKYEAVITLR